MQKHPSEHVGIFTRAHLPHVHGYSELAYPDLDDQWLPGKRIRSFALSKGEIRRENQKVKVHPYFQFLYSLSFHLSGQLKSKLKTWGTIQFGWANHPIWTYFGQKNLITDGELNQGPVFAREFPETIPKSVVNRFFINHSQSWEVYGRVNPTLNCFHHLSSQ